ncbi:dithiol-disulfide isomerase [Sporosarcina sp. P26b]|uniref:DsbA family protein n=1 Tax=Sporosarcina TaxID=1569 RepID=UPI000A17D71B|nr:MULTISPECIES: DsbA family protein [Sporosarcina]ARK22536.1 dithiol-disulfide isomerase [Sporosarcina ureae]PIC72232.1 dithiol-disulfide isomerase [Sporosarcina sp. P17b]PIC96989.1 dithiol-disulfide isomerase [Sporosarcina sp. P26b]
MNYLTVIDDTLHYSASVKPIELYVFLDPYCKDCWSLQPLLRKLQVEYDHYFTLRIALKTPMTKLNVPSLLDPKDAKTTKRSNPCFPSIAVKAAEFQGKRAGFRYLSSLLEYSFLKKRDVASFSVLVEIAARINLDVDEFITDFTSEETLRALQVDMYLGNEMEVDEAPTFVFFNSNIEDEGLKVGGLYDYSIYEQILEELVGGQLLPDMPPSMDSLFNRFDLLTTKEIAEMCHMTEKEADRELKKRILKQEIERVCVPERTLWRKKQPNCSLIK